jgi:pimeloyl-ACP methyl ester carboxylesterase
MGVQVASLPNGRNLGYCIVGKGKPVLYFHGTASSRLEVLLFREIAESSGLQLVSVDRPGYGLSTYYKRTSLQDFNSDVTFLADYLGFERFSVLGWSGGGAFALAILALTLSVSLEPFLQMPPLYPSMPLQRTIFHYSSTS